VLAALAIAPIAAIALDSPRSGGGGEAGPATTRAANAGLRGFHSCANLRRYARRHSEAVSYPVGIADGAPIPPGAGTPGAAGGEATDSGSASGSTPTNVQEPGIDEPDIVKAAGSQVFALAQGKLRSIDVSGAAPLQLGAIDLSELPGNAGDGYDHQLLLAGDRLLLITQTSGGYEGGGTGGPPGIVAPDIYYGSPRTVLSEIDVSDPAAMSVVRTLRVEGGYVSARLAGETARVVVSSFPEYAFATAGSAGTQRRGTEKLIPSTVIRDEVAGTSHKSRLVPCRSIRRPREFSGLEMLSVLTIDLGQGLDPTDVDTIMTQGQTVYSSPESLYVATERWLPPDAGERQVSSVNTEIHRFALGSPTETEYAASGTVPGFMLSQWALSEQDGFLRVASTEESPEFDVGDRESFVTVLGQSGDDLEPVGRVGGLGRGESIYAVRFIGDVGYVVTFRQVDPLYTVDLSDPTDPRVAGELKVPGYSAYLHPVGEGMLLGVGQDANDQGRTRGTQVSLFDVADPAAPSSLDRVALGEGSSSEVEYDHHAFLLYPPTGLAVIPLEVYGPDGAGFAGAVGFHVGPTGIDEIGRISHPAEDGGTGGDVMSSMAVRRSLVAGGRLLTLSESGLMSHDLATLSEQGFLNFD
jgi:hypothetical protein